MDERVYKYQKINKKWRQFAAIFRWDFILESLQILF